jgi:hypothetical protein
MQTEYVVVVIVVITPVSNSRNLNLDDSDLLATVGHV